MVKNNKAFEIIVITLLATMAGYIGLSMSIVGIVYPILLTLIGIKSGIKSSILSFVLSIILLGTITSSMDMVILFISYGLLSMVTVYMIRKNYEASKVMIVSIAVLLLTTIINIGLNWYINGINIVSELDNSLSTMIEEQVRVLKTQDFSSREVSMISSFLNNMADYITALIPTMLIISSTLVSYVNYYIPTKILSKSGRRNIEVPYFSKLIFPKNSLLGLGIILVLTYLLKYFSQFNYDQMVLNVTMLIFYVFTLEGLSLVTFVLNKMKTRNIFKYFVILAIILTGFLNIAIFSIGVIDVVIDFRKLRKPRST